MTALSDGAQVAALERALMDAMFTERGRVAWAVDGAAVVRGRSVSPTATGSMADGH